MGSLRRTKRSLEKFSHPEDLRDARRPIRRSRDQSGGPTNSSALGILPDEERLQGRIEKVKDSPIPGMASVER